MIRGALRRSRRLSTAPRQRLSCRNSFAKLFHRRPLLEKLSKPFEGKAGLLTQPRELGVVATADARYIMPSAAKA